MRGAHFELSVRFATGTVDRLDLLPRPQQAAAGAARCRVDDDPRALRGSGPGDRRPPQPLPARRPGGRAAHGPPAPRARRALRRQVLRGAGEAPGILRPWTCSTNPAPRADRKSTRLNSSHANISYAVFCLKKKKNIQKVDKVN